MSVPPSAAGQRPLPSFGTRQAGHRTVTGKPTWDLRRARCGVSRTAGSGSGPGKRAGRKTGTAPRTDFTTRTAAHRSLGQRPPAGPLARPPARPSGPYDATGSAASCTSTCTSHDVTVFSAPTGWPRPSHPAEYGDDGHPLAVEPRGDPRRPRVGSRTRPQGERPRPHPKVGPRGVQGGQLRRASYARTRPPPPLPPAIQASSGGTTARSPATLIGAPDTPRSPECRSQARYSGAWQR